MYSRLQVSDVTMAFPMILEPSVGTFLYKITYNIMGKQTAAIWKGKMANRYWFGRGWLVCF
jgi:hypothetical protein